MKIDSKGWLISGDADPPAVRVPSVRRCKLSAGGPFGVCQHWTGGEMSQTTDLAFCRSIARYNPASDIAKSWHIYGSREGIIYQCVPQIEGAWHVSKSTPGGGPDLRGKVNRKLLGDEWENYGRLLRHGDKFYHWPYWTEGGTTRIPNPHCMVSGEVVEVDGVFYHAFTPAQIVALEAITWARHEWRPDWQRSAFEHYHADFDPLRKPGEPGELFKRELAAVLDRVFAS